MNNKPKKYVGVVAEWKNSFLVSQALPPSPLQIFLKKPKLTEVWYMLLDDFQSLRNEVAFILNKKENEKYPGKVSSNL